MTMPDCFRFPARHGTAVTMPERGVLLEIGQGAEYPAGQARWRF